MKIGQNDNNSVVQAIFQAMHEKKKNSLFLPPLHHQEEAEKNDNEKKGRD